MSTSNQLELFENEINSSTSLQKLEIEYVKDFFYKTESDILFDFLSSSTRASICFSCPFFPSLNTQILISSFCFNDID